MTKLQSPGSSLEAWEEIDCILCGRYTQTRVVWPDEERGHIVRCGECGLCYRNPRRREEDLLRHFEKEWTEGIQSFLLEEYRQENLRRLAHWILRAHPGPGAILDVGSSYGNLLAQFPETWRRVGLEPSQKACRISQERLPGAQIIQGALGSAPLPERAFDVITMVDTVYYLPHPLRDLTRLTGFLKPGGTMFLEAPNFANRGQVYRWLGHAFEDTWMYFYTPVTLGKILKKVGLKMGVLAYNLLHMIRQFYVRVEKVKRSVEWLIKRLIKVGARVSYHARRWYVHVASAFPLAHHFRAVLAWGS